jgi:protein SCO1
VKDRLGYIKIFGALAVAVLLPLSFYLLAKGLSKDKLVLPRRYGVAHVDTIQKSGKTRYDTGYVHIPDITLTNQLHEQVSTATLQNRALVVNFMCRSCINRQTRATQNMRMLQLAFRKDNKHEYSLDTMVQLLSITTDPAADSFATLRLLADSMGVDHDRWWWLTGDKQTIDNFSNAIFDNLPDKTADRYNTLVLLDKRRNIRGYYNGLDTADIRRCADEIVLLTLEKEKTPNK